MKNLITAGTFCLLLVACGNNEPQSTPAAEAPAAAAPVFVSPIAYSSKFEMGNTKYSEMVVQIWKDFDENKLDVNIAYFADSVKLDLPGMTFNNTRDSLLSMMKGFRGSLPAVESKIDAVMSVKTTDAGDDWVLIWGREYITSGSKVDSSSIHEAWRFNKAGKIDWMMQYKR